jgi:hypothetical protein
MVLSKPDDTGPTPAQRPRSVVTTSRSSPMVGHHAGNLPRTHLRGDSCAPARSRAPGQPTGTWRWTSVLGRPGGKCGAPASARAKRRPRSAVATPASHPLPDARSSLPRQARFGQRHPSRSPTTAPRRTRCAHRGRSRGTDAFRDPARCGQRGCSGRGHRTRVSVRTPALHRSRGHRTPGHRTSARPVGRTSVRMADRGCGQSDGRRGRCPDMLDGHDGGGRRLGGANLARVAASAALGNR